MIMPRPLSGFQIKAEIKGFLLKYRLFQYKHWFFLNFELKDFPEYTFTPCMISWQFSGNKMKNKGAYNLEISMLLQKVF